VCIRVSAQTATLTVEKSLGLPLPKLISFFSYFNQKCISAMNTSGSCIPVLRWASRMNEIGCNLSSKDRS